MIHGAFTAEQWAELQKDFAVPAADACTGRCIDEAKLGQRLFFEPALSGPWVSDPAPPGFPPLHRKHPAGKTSCATCHDAKSGTYIDTRPGSATSMGATSPTKHNTITLLNVGAKQIYTWAGECTDPKTKVMSDCKTPRDVVHDIALPNAMKSDAEIVRRAIVNNPTYLAEYQTLFPNALDTKDQYQDNLEHVLDSYMKKLVSVESPFDKFIRDDDTALSESATRGFALFVGRAMCVECHRGPYFTDDDFHITGVIDTRVPMDGGRGGTGKFFTAGLRNIAETAPYMHNGSLDTLADVIWFYRQGGMASGFVGAGHKDPLMQPLDITDEEAADLEAFLRALSGAPLTNEVRADTHVPAFTNPTPMTCQVPNSSNTGLVCNGECKDVINDKLNCGSCGHTCSSYCMAGMCGP